MSIYSFRIYIEFLFQTRKWITHIQQNSLDKRCIHKRKSTKRDLKSFLFIISQTKVKMSNSTIGMPDTDYFLSFSCMIDANYPFTRKDSFVSIESKLARLYIETIEDTVTLNGYESLYQAVDIMQKTSGINLFGLSDNLLAAQQFQTKLLRIGKMSHVAMDVYEGSYLSRTCPIDSCAIVLSYTGETSVLLEETECLKKRGIPVIAITSVDENCLDLNESVSRKEMEGLKRELEQKVPTPPHPSWSP